MDFDVIFQFIGEHLGEIILGIELFLLNVFGKPKTKEELLECKRKALEKKKAKNVKAVMKLDAATSRIQEEERSLMEVE